MTDSVVVIDSSDDEITSTPAKKMKYDTNGTHSDESFTELKIIDVKSLAEPKLDVIEIDSDDNINDKENTVTIERISVEKQHTNIKIIELKDISVLKNYITGFSTVVKNNNIKNDSIDKQVNKMIINDDEDDDVMFIEHNADDVINSLKTKFDESPNNISENNTKDIKEECDISTNIQPEINLKQNGENNRSKSIDLPALNIEPINATDVNAIVTIKDSESICSDPASPETTESKRSDLDEFINICITNINTKYKDIVITKSLRLKEIYKEADTAYTESKTYKKLIDDCIEKSKSNPANIIVHFKRVYEELKVHKEKQRNLTDKQEDYLNKLSTTLKKLDKKIKQLEEKEVDFNDDSESAYIQVDRYKQRFVQVHKKYCAVLKEDAYASRLTHRKLDFCSSNYIQINQAIDKLYMKQKKFPLFEEVDACVRKTVTACGINLSEADIKMEIRKMHKEMGKLIQRRRKLELDEAHTVFLGQAFDPAISDPQLKERLDKQLIEGNEKLEKIFDTYTKKQMEGENPTISPDSDDSNIKSDDEKLNESLDLID